MKNRKVKIGIFVIFVLIVTFFWGGNKTVNPLDSNEIYVDIDINQDEINKEQN